MPLLQKSTEGELKLPDVELSNDAEYEAVWALLDSGSSVHVVNASKVFPGAKINKPDRAAKGFTVANGKHVPDLGTLTTPVQLPDGSKRQVMWKNAEVELPILSTHEIARNNKSLTYFEDHGFIDDLKTGHRVEFIQAGGVYFVMLLVPKNITNGPDTAGGCCGLNHGRDFVRRG